VVVKQVLACQNLACKSGIREGKRKRTGYENLSFQKNIPSWQREGGDGIVYFENHLCRSLQSSESSGRYGGQINCPTSGEAK